MPSINIIRACWLGIARESHAYKTVLIVAVSVRITLIWLTTHKVSASQLYRLIHPHIYK